MFRAKDCPKYVELILEINKLLLLHLVGFSVLLYLQSSYSLQNSKFYCRSHRVRRLALYRANSLNLIQSFNFHFDIILPSTP